MAKLDHLRVKDNMTSLSGFRLLSEDNISIFVTSNRLLVLNRRLLIDGRNGSLSITF